MEFRDHPVEFTLPLLVDLIGCDYTYRGRDPDEGLDCLGLVMLAAKKFFNVTIPELVDYPEDWATKGFAFYEDHWDKVFKQVDLVLPGTLLLFQFGSPTPNHAGVYAGHQKIIHAYQDFKVSYGKVDKYKKFLVKAGIPRAKQPQSLD